MKRSDWWKVCEHFKYLYRGMRVPVNEWAAAFVNLNGCQAPTAWCSAGEQAMDVVRHRRKQKGATRGDAAANIWEFVSRMYADHYDGQCTYSCSGYCADVEGSNCKQ